MIWQPNKWTITRGDDAQVVLHLLDSDGSPINISGASAVNLLVKNTDGSILSLTAYAGFTAGLGRAIWIYAFQFTAAQTKALPLGTNATIEVDVLWGTLSQKFSMSGVLTTVDPVI